MNQEAAKRHKMRKMGLIEVQAARRSAAAKTALTERRHNLDSFSYRVRILARRLCRTK
jgi:hypothetical protein